MCITLFNAKLKTIESGDNILFSPLETVLDLFITTKLFIVKNTVMFTVGRHDSTQNFCQDFKFRESLDG